MRWLWAIVFYCAAAMAQAQTVRVTTGDHPGFTRLVLEAEGLAGWRLSRLSDGYALTLRRPVRFDIDGAFRVISRDRLADLSRSDDGRGLLLKLACACHAIAFDYRSGIVVIDLRDGPPPAGSSFEQSADGKLFPPLVPAQAAAPPPIPPPQEWDWTELALEGGPELPAPLTVPTLPDRQALALRSALMKEFALGASSGLVDPLGKPPLLNPKSAPVEGPARIALAELPGLAGLSPLDSRPDLSAEGLPCIADDSLNIAAWGDPDKPALDQFAEPDGFLGEFDRPDPTALAHSVQRHLWLGLGAETVALVDTFAPDASEAPLWRAMARAIDGSTAEGGYFNGMAACDGWAAFWSVLESPRLSLSMTDTAAVVRSFSMLPPHLRSATGPVLINRFIQAGDQSTVQGLRNAMLRVSSGGGALADAQMALRAGMPAQAEEEARQVLDDGGPESAEALAAIAEAQFQARKTVSAQDVTALEAMLEEQPSNAGLIRALILSRGLAGDFDAAFDDLADAPPNLAAATRPDLWALLAEMGSDSALIAHGVGAPDSAQVASDATRIALAKRLTILGFGDAALSWLQQVNDPVAKAEAELANEQPRAALTLLSGALEPAAARPRAMALFALGQPEAAADVFAKLGQDAEADELNARLKARDWQHLRQQGPDAWQTAATELDRTLFLGKPLSDGRAVLAKSETTRSAIEALLSDATNLQGMQ